MQIYQISSTKLLFSQRGLQYFFSKSAENNYIQNVENHLSVYSIFKCIFEIFKHFYFALMMHGM